MTRLLLLYVLSHLITTMVAKPTQNFGYVAPDEPTTTIDYDLADFDEFVLDPVTPGPVEYVGFTDTSAGNADSAAVMDPNYAGSDVAFGVGNLDPLSTPYWNVQVGTTTPDVSADVSVEESDTTQTEGGPTDEGRAKTFNKSKSPVDNDTAGTDGDEKSITGKKSTNKTNSGGSNKKDYNGAGKSTEPNTNTNDTAGTSGDAEPNDPDNDKGMDGSEKVNDEDMPLSGNKGREGTQASATGATSDKTKSSPSEAADKDYSNGSMHTSGGASVDGSSDEANSASQASDEAMPGSDSTGSGSVSSETSGSDSSSIASSEETSASTSDEKSEESSSSSTDSESSGKDTSSASGENSGETPSTESSSSGSHETFRSGSGNSAQSSESKSSEETGNNSASSESEPGSDPSSESSSRGDSSSSSESNQSNESKQSPPKDLDHDSDGHSYHTNDTSESGTLGQCFRKTESEHDLCKVVRALKMVCLIQFPTDCFTRIRKRSVSSDSQTASGATSETSFKYSAQASSHASQESPVVDGPFGRSSEQSKTTDTSVYSSKSNSLTLESISMESISESFEQSQSVAEVMAVIKSLCPVICSAEDQSINSAYDNDPDTDIDFDGIDSNSKDEDSMADNSDESYDNSLEHNNSWKSMESDESNDVDDPDTDSVDPDTMEDASDNNDSMGDSRDLQENLDIGTGLTLDDSSQSRITKSSEDSSQNTSTETVESSVNDSDTTDGDAKDSDAKESDATGSMTMESGGGSSENASK